MDDKKESPKWVVENLDRLKKIKPKIEAVKKEGQEEAKRGLEKIKKADDLRKEIEYLTNVLSSKHDSQYWNDEIVTQRGLMLTNRISRFDQDMDNIQATAKASSAMDIENHTHFVFAVDSLGSTAGTAVFLGASIESRFQAIEPSYKPFLVDLEPKRITERQALFDDLKVNLVQYGEKFVNMLLGSEAALGVNNPDSQTQAAHSMRDCFQQLIEQLSPDDVIRTQPWFEATKGAPGGVSRRSRIRYLLYGSGEKIDDETIQKFDELVEIAKSSLDICIARAHDHDPSLTKEEVQLIIDQARNSLSQILFLHKKLRSK